MSHRAIQRLRQERASEILGKVNDGDEDDDSEDSDDDSEILPVKATGFQFIGDDSSSEEDSEVESDADEDKSVEQSQTAIPDKTVVPSQENEPVQAPEDNFDDILDEFKTIDIAHPAEKQAEGLESTGFAVIAADLDYRDFDIDYSMRASVQGSLSSSDKNVRPRRMHADSSLFGQTIDTRNRPPHFIGGGLGMASYGEQSHNSTDPAVAVIPWPYDRDDLDHLSSEKLWFKFIRSENYTRDLLLLDSMTNFGDPNMLSMLLADKPYITEALLKLSEVLYQTNQKEAGLALLRRALRVYECASQPSFMKIDGGLHFMDYNIPENKGFFTALFKLMKVSRMHGLSLCSLTLSRFLLALDPLRDPMGVLLSIDFLSLSCASDRMDTWLVNFVESKAIQIFHRFNEHTLQGALLDLPNLSYSYALALYRKAKNTGTDEDLVKSDLALQNAIFQYPCVIEKILESNEINIKGKSCAVDWSSVLQPLSAMWEDLLQRVSDSEQIEPEVKQAAANGAHRAIKIFVKQNHKLWAANDIVNWLYRNAHHLVNSKGRQDEISMLPLGMARYSDCDEANYDDRIDTLPEVGNVLDPTLLQYALHVDPNRGRILQRLPPGMMQNNHAQQFNGAMPMGPPRQQIDPDSPLLEIFLRSLLPWTDVAGADFQER